MPINHPNTPGEERKISSHLPLFLSKSDFALMYSPHLAPHSAVNKLMSWIHFNKELYSKLIESGYRKTQKQFNRAQISLIYDYLGEP